MNAAPTFPAAPGRDATSLAVRLQQQTREQHAALEAHPLLRQLTGATLTRAAYQLVIERMLGFYAPLESALSRPAAHIPALDYHSRWKTPLLAHDLDVLRQNRAAYPPVPRCTHLPAIQTPSQALGVWYVAEGATLGGRVILKHLRRTLGVSAGFGASFFAGYQDATGRNWRAFLQMLEAQHTSGWVNGDACIQAAADTFSALHAWFDATPTASLARLPTLHGRPTPLSPSR